MRIRRERWEYRSSTDTLHANRTPIVPSSTTIWDLRRVGTLGCIPKQLSGLIPRRVNPVCLLALAVDIPPARNGRRYPTPQTSTPDLRVSRIPAAIG
jgi:hypothetical protein